MFGTDDLRSCESFHLIAKNQFTSSIGREDLEERDVLLKVLQSLEFVHELQLAKQVLELDLLLQKIFLLIPLAGGHDRRPDHADRLWLGQAVLLHVLPQLGDDLLLALALGDAVLQVPLKLLDLFGEN